MVTSPHQQWEELTSYNRKRLIALKTRGLRIFLKLSAHGNNPMQGRTELYVRITIAKTSQETTMAHHRECASSRMVYHE